MKKPEAKSFDEISAQELTDTDLENVVGGADAASTGPIYEAPFASNGTKMYGVWLQTFYYLLAKAATGDYDSIADATV